MLTLTSPIETWAHRLPAWLKLAALSLATMALFALHAAAWLGLATLATIALQASGGAAFLRQSLQMLRPLVAFIVVIALWHLILREPGGIAIILRMLTAVALANFVSMTTRLADMITVIEAIARPFAAILPTKTLALAIALTIRFVPTMVARAAEIRESWRARSPKRPGWRILLPTTLAALDDAERVAEALRARGGLS